ncbi:MAG: cytochrome c3 family protein [Candidatus Zixiibacteriota bacterium]
MSIGRVFGRLVVGGSVIFAVMGIAESPSEWMESRPVSAHESVDCGRCHLFVASTSEESFKLPNQEAECRSCHMASLSAKAQTTFPLGFHENKGRDCRECHFFHKRDLLHTDSLIFSMGKSSLQRDAVCVLCHQSGSRLDKLSPGHRQAAEIVHSGWMSQIKAGPSAVCLACHSQHGTAQIESKSGITTPQFDDRIDHPYGVAVRGTPMRDGVRIRHSIDSRLRLVDSKLECLTCHDLTANNRHRLVIAESQTALCVGCHEFE